MKISIDTASDSKEDIRKAIRLLQSIVEHDAAHSRDIFASPSTDIFGNTPATSAPADSNPVAAFGNLFGDNAPAQQPTTSTVVDIPEDKKDLPKIELY